MTSVFGEDEIGNLATVLFQSALTTRTRGNYNYNLASFYTFCETSLLDPLAVGPIDIAHYIARWDRGELWAERACIPTSLPSINC